MNKCKKADKFSLLQIMKVKMRENNLHNKIQYWVIDINCEIWF